MCDFVAHREQVIASRIKLHGLVDFSGVNSDRLPVLSCYLQSPRVYVDRTAMIFRKISGSFVTTSFGPTRTNEPGGYVSLDSGSET